ncbi:MAG: alpha/beta hydrolase family esterase [Polyangiales bacterium]
MKSTRDLLVLVCGLCLLGLGCGSDDGSPASSKGPSLGCQDGSLDASTTHFELEHDGVTRSYELHLPPGYDGTTALPLVLNFHGFTSNGLGQQSSTNMDLTADREGFIVAYPNGLDVSWNAGLCCGRSATDDVDDVGFTRAMIDDIGARGCIDESRVYATGMSNGGFFSHRLACEAADVIAAVAPVAGVLGIEEEACAPSRPIPIIHLHGTGDTLVPYEGGGLANSLSVEDSTEGWLDRNGCTGERDVSYEEGDATCVTYAKCQGDASVTVCTIEGGGHCWPGQPCRELGDLGASTTDIDANEAMWRLFSTVELR